MHPRFDAALRPSVLGRSPGRRRRHASGKTFLFSSSSQFLSQGLFAAPRQDTSVLDGFFGLLCGTDAVRLSRDHEDAIAAKWHREDVIAATTSR